MGAHVDFDVANWARHLSAEKLLKADVTPRQIRVWIAVVDLVANYSRLEDNLSIARIAATAGITGKNEHRVGQRVSADLQRLAELEIIKYLPGGQDGRRRSVVGLLVPTDEDLPESIRARRRGTRQGSPSNPNGEPVPGPKGNPHGVNGEPSTGSRSSLSSTSSRAGELRHLEGGSPADTNGGGLRTADGYVHNGDGWVEEEAS